ncbi:MAG: multicopper oxidase domain-containing protein [Chloroflexota bacterium]
MTNESGPSNKGLVALASILAVAALLLATVAVLRGGAGGGGESKASAEPIKVELGDIFIKPKALSAAVGSDVTLEVTNTGKLDHDLGVKGGPKTELLKPGQKATLKLPKVSGTVSLICSVPGHAEAGMVTELTVAGGAAVAGHAAMPAGGMTAAQMDESYLKGVKAYPAKTAGEGNVPMTPKMDGQVKVFEMTAEEIDWEVAPGDVRKGMAYNKQIPGPMIRVNLGDKVRIVLNNKLKESTAMHFHGLQVPNAVDGVPGLTQPLVEPGKSFTYEFTVPNTGSHMYHSHMNGATQIPAGLLGAFIVDGPGDPASAKEQVMILNDGPLGYTLNGKGFPATAPIVLKKGEKIRIRYMNEGLQIHPMHLHGLIQTVFSKDGNLLPQSYKADTVLVAPGERVDVMVEGAEVGLWAFHCHVLSHAESEAGMFGMVTAVIVQ